MTQRALLDLRQAAEFLGISMDSLSRYAQQGKVPAVKMGNHWKFRPLWLERWLDDECKRQMDGRGK